MQAALHRVTKSAPSFLHSEVQVAAIEARPASPLRIVEPAVETGRAQDPDAGLVKAAQAGCKKSFELLVLKHQRAIIALTQRIVGEADAPDVAQEAFLRVHRALPGFKGDSLFSTWIYRIAVNSGKNHLAARRCRPTLQDVDVADAELFGHTAQLSNIETPESQLLSEELKGKLMAAIRKLPLELREAITLREFETLSYRQIATIMKCPVGTVRSRIFRARELLDAVIEPLLA